MFILGVFSIYVCCPSQSLTSYFLDLIYSFNLIQSVKGATHSEGHTFDLVLNLKCFNLVNVPLTDHKAVCKCQYNSPLPVNTFLYCQRRLCSALIQLPFISFHLCSVQMFVNDSCLSILDQIAPLKMRKLKSNKHP